MPHAVITITCHPERRHHARGLCKACYHRAYDRETKERRPAKGAECHPELPHQALGLCAVCYNREWRSQNRLPTEERTGRGRLRTRRKLSDEELRLYRREYGARARYGIEPEGYEALLDFQGGGCGICGSKTSVNPHGKNDRLSVDHDHATGRVRGLLCSHCNKGLGLFRDSTTSLRAAAEYLERSLAPA